MNLNTSIHKNNNIYYILLLILFLIIFKFVFDAKLDLNGDNFDYLNYATSIINGNGYSSPYTPNNTPISHYPPGYSFFLASVMLIFGKNIIVFKLLNGIFYFLSIFFLFKITNIVCKNKPLAFSVAILLIFNSRLMRFSTIIMTESPYLLVCVLALYFIIKDRTTLFNEKDTPLKSLNFYLILLFSCMSYYLRGIGLSLICTIFLYWLFNKKYKHSLYYLVGTILLLLPWHIRNKSLGLGGRYIYALTVSNNWRPEEGTINSFSGFIHKFVMNFYDTVIKGFTEVIFPGINVSNIPPIFLWILGIIILSVIIYGAIKTKHFKWFFIFYLITNIGIFLLYHAGNGSRYVVPLAPFITLLLCFGLYNLIYLCFKIKSEKILKYISFSFMILALINITKLEQWNKYAKSNYNPAMDNYMKIAKMLKSKEIKDVVCCRKPGIFYFFYESYVRSYKFSLNDKVIMEDMKQNDVKYVILDQLGYSSTGRYLYPAIKKNPQVYRALFSLKQPNTYLIYFDKTKIK